jgi:hypothetical protein
MRHEAGDGKQMRNFQDCDLTRADCELIIQSLEFTRIKFESYGGYPSYEFKQSRIGEVSDVLEKVRTIKRKSA